MLTLNSKGANWGSKYKLYLFAHEKHTHAVFLKYIRSFLIDLLRLHDTSGCQTGWTTGWMFVYTMQPVVQPVWQPAVLCTRGFNDHARKDFAAMSFLCCGKCVQPVILWVARHRYCQYLLSVNSLDKSIFSTTILISWILRGRLSLAWQLASYSSWGGGFLEHRYFTR